MKLVSPAFKNEQEIPICYTGDSDDLSPPLHWSHVPEGCREFALVCEDPDAPKRFLKDHPFVHWILYHIPITAKSLPQGLPALPKLYLSIVDHPTIVYQGVNSFKSLGYRGPLPPRGHGLHRYIFTLYALDKMLDLPPQATKKQLYQAMDGHVLKTALLIGTYERPKIQQIDVTVVARGFRYTPGNLAFE